MSNRHVWTCDQCGSEVSGLGISCVVLPDGWVRSTIAFSLKETWLALPGSKEDWCAPCLEAIRAQLGQVFPGRTKP